MLSLWAGSLIERRAEQVKAGGHPGQHAGRGHHGDVEHAVVGSDERGPLGDQRLRWGQVGDRDRARAAPDAVRLGLQLDVERLEVEQLLEAGRHVREHAPALARLARHVVDRLGVKSDGAEEQHGRLVHARRVQLARDTAGDDRARRLQVARDVERLGDRVRRPARQDAEHRVAPDQLAGHQRGGAVAAGRDHDRGAGVDRVARAGVGVALTRGLVDVELEAIAEVAADVVDRDRRCAAGDRVEHDRRADLAGLSRLGDHLRAAYGIAAGRRRHSRQWGANRERAAQRRVHCWWWTCSAASSTSTPRTSRRAWPA